MKKDYIELFPISKELIIDYIKTIKNESYSKCINNETIKFIKNTYIDKKYTIEIIPYTNMNFKNIIKFPNCVENCIYNFLIYLITDNNKISIENIDILNQNYPLNKLKTIFNKELVKFNINKLNNYLKNKHQEFTDLCYNISICKYAKEYLEEKYELFGDFINFANAINYLLGKTEDLNDNTTNPSSELLKNICTQFNKKLIDKQISNNTYEPDKFDCKFIIDSIIVFDLKYQHDSIKLVETINYSNYSENYLNSNIFINNDERKKYKDLEIIKTAEEIIIPMINIIYNDNDDNNITINSTKLIIIPKYQTEKLTFKGEFSTQINCIKPEIQVEMLVKINNLDNLSDFATNINQIKLSFPQLNYIKFLYVEIEIPQFANPKQINPTELEILNKISTYFNEYNSFDLFYAILINNLSNYKFPINLENYQSIRMCKNLHVQNVYISISDDILKNILYLNLKYTELNKKDIILPNCIELKLKETNILSVKAPNCKTAFLSQINELNEGDLPECRDLTIEDFENIFENALPKCEKIKLNMFTLKQKEFNITSNLFPSCLELIIEGNIIINFLPNSLNECIKLNLYNATINSIVNAPKCKVIKLPKTFKENINEGDFPECRELSLQNFSNIFENALPKCEKINIYYDYDNELEQKTINITPNLFPSCSELTIKGNIRLNIEINSLNKCTYLHLNAYLTTELNYLPAVKTLTIDIRSLSNDYNYPIKKAIFPNLENLQFNYFHNIIEPSDKISSIIIKEGDFTQLLYKKDFPNLKELVFPRKYYETLRTINQEDQQKIWYDENEI